MSPSDSRLAYLFRRYYNQTATQEEQDEFMRLLSEPEYTGQLEALMYEAWQQNDGMGTLFNEQKSEAIFNNIVKVPAEEEKVFAIAGRRRLIWASAAAVLLAVFLSGAYFFINRPARKPSIKVATNSEQPQTDVAPGGDKAVLTLADGSQIVLDSVVNGTLAKQGNTKIIKMDGGKLSYQANATSGQVLYNAIATPRGGEYQLVLGDGSKVWLNAASSLRFPTAFTGKERIVELTGEAYFEVAKDKQKPFKVKVGDMQVAVLGTHFNIMAYDEEAAIKTTLLEGSVQVSRGAENNLLQPGQQAQLSKKGNIRVVNNADVAEAVAWKNGLTSFKNADVKSIMRQVARWYNVEVKYEGNIPERIFTGEIARNANLSAILKVLQLSGIHFKLEGRTIVVMP